MKLQTVQKMVITLGVMGLVVATASFAADSTDIAGMSDKIKTQATAIGELLNVASYVAGVGFALAGILQFKAHKENPQQTPLSKPVVMLIVAAALLFLPTVLNIAGTSLFGTGKKAEEAIKQNPLGT